MMPNTKNLGIGAGSGKLSAPGLADLLAGLLSLAAAPAFAVMAAVTWHAGESPMDMLCAGIHHGSFLGGMAPMYALMSVFHLPRWLKLFSGHYKNILRMRHV
jgi:hypothetical protein